MNDQVEKAKGKVDEVVGSVTGNEEQEAKGRLRQKTVDVKENLEEAANNVKQGTAHKANDVMDKMDDSNK